MALHSVKSFTIIINHNGENLCTQVSLKIYAVVEKKNANVTFPNPTKNLGVVGVLARKIVPFTTM